MGTLGTCEEKGTDPFFFWVQVAVMAGVAAMLMLVMGGVYPAVRGAAGVAIALLFFLTWAWRIARNAVPDDWDYAWLWVWLAVSLWILLQLLPLPRQIFFWIGAYPPVLLDLYPEFPVTRLTPNLAATIGYWGTFTTYWAAAYLTAGLPRRQLGVLVAFLVTLIFAEALYGIIAHISRFETVLGLWPARDNHSVVVGTFWNRNHLAGLLALGWPLGIAYLLFSVKTYPDRIHEVRYALVVLFCIVMALALFNTLSRLGTAAGLFGLLVFALVARANRSERVSGLERFWLLLAGLVAMGLAISFGLVPLLLRYAQSIDDTGRLAALVALAALPAKTWLAGAGAGAFQDVFKLAQPASIRESLEYLHNDWVQLVLELGILGLAGVLVVLIPWWRRVRPSRLDRLRAGAMGGLTAIALHSLGDFNLQIPGTAFAFWMTLGVLTNRALEHGPLKKRIKRRHWSESDESALLRAGVPLPATVQAGDNPSPIPSPIAIPIQIARPIPEPNPSPVPGHATSRLIRRGEFVNACPAASTKSAQQPPPPRPRR